MARCVYWGEGCRWKWGAGSPRRWRIGRLLGERVANRPAIWRMYPPVVCCAQLRLMRGRGALLLVTTVGRTAALVKFRDSGGDVTCSEVASVSPTMVAAGRPWRTFRWHRGQAHFSGWYWSA